MVIYIFQVKKFLLAFQVKKFLLAFKAKNFSLAFQKKNFLLAFQRAIKIKLLVQSQLFLTLFGRYGKIF